MGVVSGRDLRNGDQICLHVGRRGLCWEKGRSKIIEDDPFRRRERVHQARVDIATFHSVKPAEKSFLAPVSPSPR